MTDEELRQEGMELLRAYSRAWGQPSWASVLLNDLDNLKAKIERLHRALDDCHTGPNLEQAYSLDNQQLREERKVLRAALEEVEWIAIQGPLFCPWCYAQKRDGQHVSTCSRQLALGKVTVSLPT